MSNFSSLFFPVSVTLTNVRPSGFIVSNPDWDTTVSIVSAYSPYWNSTYTTVCANSAAWGAGSTAVNAVVISNSANWNSTYTLLSTTTATTFNVNTLSAKGAVISTGLTVSGSGTFSAGLFVTGNVYAGGFQLYDAGQGKVVTITCYNGILSVN